MPAPAADIFTPAEKAFHSGIKHIHIPNAKVNPPRVLRISVIKPRFVISTPPKYHSKFVTGST